MKFYEPCENDWDHRWNSECAVALDGSERVLHEIRVCVKCGLFQSWDFGELVETRDSDPRLTRRVR